MTEARSPDARGRWAVLAAACLAGLVLLAGTAPARLSLPDPALAGAGPLQVPPLGADPRGIPLLDYVQQGAAVVLGPALVAGALVAVASAGAAILQCAQGRAAVRARGLLAGLREVTAALPRLVLVLVVALLVPGDQRALTPLALTWAVLAAPSGMEEAAAAAGRLGGERFVEALRAHGFSWARIHLGHVVARNLRPLLLRQGLEVVLQVVFLELALSYLTRLRHAPALAHGDDVHSWAELLHQGYAGLLGHGSVAPLGVGLLCVASLVLLQKAVAQAGRAR